MTEKKMSSAELLERIAIEQTKTNMLMEKEAKQRQKNTERIAGAIWSVFWTYFGWCTLWKFLEICAMLQERDAIYR